MMNILTYISIFVDILVIFAAFILIYILLSLLRTTPTLFYYFVLFGIISISLCPILEILGLISHDVGLSKILFKLSGIFSVISAFLLTLAALYILKLRINKLLFSFYLVITYLAIEDMIISQVHVIDIDGLHEYAVYYSQFGSVLISLIVFVLFVIYFAISVEIVKIYSWEKRIYYSLYFPLTALFLLIISYLFDVFLYPLSIARYLGPIAVLIFLIGNFYLLNIDRNVYFKLAYSIEFMILINWNIDNIITIGCMSGELLSYLSKTVKIASIINSSSFKGAYHKLILNSKKILIINEGPFTLISFLKGSDRYLIKLLSTYLKEIANIFQMKETKYEDEILQIINEQFINKIKDLTIIEKIK